MPLSGLLFILNTQTLIIPVCSKLFNQLPLFLNSRKVSGSVVTHAYKKRTPALIQLCDASANIPNAKEPINERKRKNRIAKILANTRNEAVIALYSASNLSLAINFGLVCSAFDSGSGSCFFEDFFRPTISFTSRSCTDI